MEIDTWIGIDPGATGAIAWINRNGASVVKFPSIQIRNRRSIDLELLWDLISDFDPPTSFACIEKVSAFPGQGVASMFSFGENNGIIKAMISVSGIPREFVTPQQWTRVMKVQLPRQYGPREKRTVKQKSHDRAEAKRLHKRRANELFPALSVTLETCDSILLAEYGRRSFSGVGLAESPL